MKLQTSLPTRCGASLAAFLVSLALLAVSIVPRCVVADEPAASLKEFVFKTTPEKDLKAYVHYPPGWKVSDRRPGIVFWHGGGWTGGTSAQFLTQAEHLAGLGMVAVRADYRLRAKDNGVTVDLCVEDARSAMRWVRKSAVTLGVDPDRIVAAGGSAGGHLAACVATLDGCDAKGDDLSVSCRPSALVLFNPVTNVAAVLTERPEMAERLGMTADLANRISPTLHVSKDTPPAILFFGSKDPFLAQGQEFIAAMKSAGNRAELFTADGVGHGFFNRPPWQERTLKPMDEFLTSRRLAGEKWQVAQCIIKHAWRNTDETPSDRGVAPPFLIAHSEVDETVPIAQSRILFDKLKDTGVEATMIVVKNAKHGIFTAQNEPPLSEILDKVTAFFEKHLKTAQVK